MKIKSGIISNNDINTPTSSNIIPVLRLVLVLETNTNTTIIIPTTIHSQICIDIHTRLQICTNHDTIIDINLNTNTPTNTTTRGDNDTRTITLINMNATTTTNTNTKLKSNTTLLQKFLRIRIIILVLILIHIYTNANIYTNTNMNISINAPTNDKTPTLMAVNDILLPILLQTLIIFGILTLILVRIR